MEAAKDANQTIGSIDYSFIDKINEGKEDKDKWVLEYDEKTLPTTFKITPPDSAKAGDFVAIPLTYTYTNGSTDVHWFHFVVQESDNNRPEYLVQVEYPSDEQNSTPKLPDDPDMKKLPPKSYSIPEGTEFKDDKGNEWNVTINPETGVVTAKPKDPSKFFGGEKIQVPVISHYQDPTEPDKDITEEMTAEFVIKEKSDIAPDYDAKTGKAGDTLSSSPKLDEEDKFNKKPTKYTLDSKKYKDTNGNIWNVSIDEQTGVVTATVPNAAEGETINLDGTIINVPVTAHYQGADGSETTKKANVQFLGSGTEGTHEYTEVIPFETKVEKDLNLKKGEIKVIREGEKGSKKVTLTIKDSVVDEKQTKEEVTKKPVDALIKVGEGVLDGTHEIKEEKDVPYETIIEFDDTLKPGEQKVAQEGKAGKEERTTTLTIEDGKVTKTESGEYTQTEAPVNKIIKVGRAAADNEGQVVHEEKIPFKYEIEYDENLKSGEYVVDVPGSEGSKTTTWNIVNSKVDGEPDVKVKDPVNAKIRVGKKDFTGEVKHTEKIETPFEVEYRYSDELEAGQTKVEQEGKNGSYDLEYSQNIKNGQADGKATTEKKNEVEAQKKIVVIGTKPIVDKVEKGFNTEYIYDDTLEAGKIEEKTPGKNGQTTITHYYDKDKKEIVTEEKTENPTNRVVRVGIKPIEEGTELPFETEYVYDENMEAGKTEVTQEGKKGKAKITTFFNKETGKLETKIEREEPTKKIVKYGSKTEGEVKIKDDIAYEVEIIEDPEMEAGKTEVVQDGKNGTKETTITIENSKEINRETNVIEEPIKKIIKVGTKNVCDIPEQPDKPEEPDTPDKPEGPDEPDKPNEPGKEEPGTPDKPEEPSTPDKPTVPDEPSVPGEPSVPETPNEPNGGGTTVTEEKPSEKEEAPEEESEKSEEKVEEKAEDSDVESKEDKVDETEEVVEDNIKTSVGNNDSDGADENKRLPKTGDGVNRSLYAYMMGLMGSAMMAIGVKKKNKESLDEE